MSKPAIFICYRPHLGRDVVLAKQVQVDGKWALGVAYRRRPRLRARVSLPLELVRLAEKRGIESLIIRFEPERTALELTIAEALRLGQLARIEGQPELFWPLSVFRERDFPEWEYLASAETVRIGPSAHAYPKQLAMAI